MSYFQPLITTAFSNYGLLRSSYSYRDSEIATGGVVDKKINGVNKTNEISNSKRVNSVNDPDAGKFKSAYGDILDLSDEGKAAYELISKSKDTKIEVADSSPKTLEVKEGSESKSAEKAQAEAQKVENENELTEEEKQQVKELQGRDAEVRQHEADHLAAAGQYAQGGAEYTYQTGPDGKKYAIGGSVSIDVSEVSGDPEATIAKMQKVAAAATAPAEPSAQDLKVAAAARRTEAKARVELSQNNEEKINADNNNKAENAASLEKSDSSEESESSDVNSQSAQVVSSKNSKQNVADKFLKSVISSAYMSQSVLSSNAKFANNKVNVYA